MEERLEKETTKEDFSRYDQNAGKGKKKSIFISLLIESINRSNG